MTFSNPEQLTLEEIEKRLIESFLPDKQFVASQISILEKFLFESGGLTKYDHCFHEFDGVEICQENPSDILGRSDLDFLRDVENISKQG